jgi:hypothetical protein
MQNWEKKLREIYRPDGYTDVVKEKCLYWLETGETTQFTEQELLLVRVFIQSDQSGAEALIVAYEADAMDYRQLFIHNVKPHVYVAMHLFRDVWIKKLKEHGGSVEDFDIESFLMSKISMLKQKPYWKELESIIKASDNWPATERYYYLAKQTCHSANYGIEAQTFRMNLLEKSGGTIYLETKVAASFLDTYRGLFPEIPERCRRIASQVRSARVLFNLFGDPYQITDFEGHLDSKLKEYYAWSAQSTVGEITRQATIDLDEYIVQNNKPWDILADTHDSYVVQCPLLFVKEAKDKMKQFMNIELTSPNDGTKFRMKSEQQIGFNWNSKKDKDHNPLGLQEVYWLN